jgi:quercetin dioxygenase-like cupin family protein
MTLVTALPIHQSYIAGGVYAKEWIAGKPGSYIEQHQHSFDHLSYLASGTVEVDVEGQKTVYIGPAGINIKAHKSHKITALSSGVLWLCIHAIPDELRDSTLIEKALISE